VPQPFTRLGGRVAGQPVVAAPAHVSRSEPVHAFFDFGRPAAQVDSPAETALMTQELEVSLELGRMSRKSSMPEGWGESGARLPLRSLKLRFRPEASPSRVLKAQSRRLEVTSDPWFIGMAGQVNVAVDAGSWLLLPEGSGNTLRFYVDLPHGASKNDVDLKAGERLFFTLGVWDTAELMALKAREKDLRQQMDGLRNTEVGLFNQWRHSVATYDKNQGLQNRLREVTWPAAKSLDEADVELGAITVQSTGQVYIERNQGFSHVGRFAIRQKAAPRPAPQAAKQIYA
jgi:hypothetical protein